MPTISNFYTMQEASLHNTKDDCWIVVDGKVYDVTQYLDDHPGGDDVLIAATGKDATDDFEDAGHSKTARELMAEYYIGELDTSPPPLSTKEPVSEKFMQLRKQYLAASMALVGISVIVGFLYLRKK
ncbi:cytochrome b5 [Lotus japonicus]|uniref:Cytochrome b5 heme-binding domain-containing protein n=1 Tax=Lotus japonicus TaxID=34305 RepID=I3RZP2_LOTJA|nr:cytochrome b5 [Lotus japonicus]AFK33484.1 unknown [Lotus japonicus]